MRMLPLIALAAALPFAGLAPARAMAPAAALVDAPPNPSIVAVSGGCGPGGHRDLYGRCVPNYPAYYAPRPFLPPPRPFYRPCPPGFHFGPRAGRCFPNY